MKIPVLYSIRTCSISKLLLYIWPVHKPRIFSVKVMNNSGLQSFFGLEQFCQMNPFFKCISLVFFLKSWWFYNWSYIKSLNSHIRILFRQNSYFLLLMRNKSIFWRAFFWTVFIPEGHFSEFRRVISPIRKAMEARMSCHWSGSWLLGMKPRSKKWHLGIRKKSFVEIVRRNIDLQPCYCQNFVEVWINEFLYAVIITMTMLT